VCKHWLRGLCKKGDACEFLHEYNLRRMPECWWFAKYGYCSAGDECLYAHPKERRVECPDYNRGFCKLGEFLILPFYNPLLIRRRSYVSSKAYKKSCMSAIFDRVLPFGHRLYKGTVNNSTLYGEKYLLTPSFSAPSHIYPLRRHMTPHHPHPLKI
jgi:hypothetical protein